MRSLADFATTSTAAAREGIATVVAIRGAVSVTTGAAKLVGLGFGCFQEEGSLMLGERAD